MMGELETAVRVLGFSLKELQQLMENAYHACFIPDAIKSKFWKSASAGAAAGAAASS